MITYHINSAHYRSASAMRPETKIPAAPELPYPITCSSEVVCGFGRGSSELGIPTANVPIEDSLEKLDTGIYFGWCELTPQPEKDCKVVKSEAGKDIYFNYGLQLKGEDTQVLPMVMSLGWNPFYNNDQKAAEVHVMHEFSDNFYGAKIRFVILGYIRPELNYTTKGM